MVGNEYAPVLQANYQPDLFVERGYSFRHDDSEFLNGWVSMFVDKLPAWAVPGHAYLWTLYRRGQEVSTGPMKTFDLPFTTVRASTNSLDQDGAAPGTNDIEFQTDGNYIRFRTGGTGESYIRLAVDSAAATPFFAVENKRIVDVSIMYAASAEPGNDDPVPLEINHYNFCTSQRVPYGNATVALRESLIADLQRSRWGEIGTWNWTGNSLTESTARYPWNSLQLQNFGGVSSNWGVEFRTASAAQDLPREIRLHHARMRITYCEENRQAVAGMVAGSDYINGDVTTGEPFSGYLPGRNTPNSFSVGMINPQGYNYNCGTGSSFFSSGNTQVNDLTLTLKRADYGAYNNQGPLPELRALRTVDVFPGHPGVVINNTLEPGAFNTVSQTDLIPQIILHTEPEGAEADWQAPAVPWIHPYGVQEPLAVFGGQPVVQEVLETANGTDVPYPQLRFWARHNAATAALQVSIETSEQGPITVAYVSTSDFETFPEIADGWRQITIPVDTALLVDDDGGILSPGAPRWESDTSEFKAWEILAARVRRENWDSSWTMPINPLISGTTGRATYGDELVEGSQEGNNPSTDDIDVAVVWGQALPTLEGLTVTLETQPLEIVDSECPIPAACIADGLYYLSVTWAPQDEGYEFVGLGSYELQRQDATMDPDEWEIVAQAIHPLVDQFDDYEVRVDVETRYRIRYVHQNGMFGAWSTQATGEVPAPGVSGVQTNKGVLIFSSNVDPSHNLAYVQVWGGAANEDFEFVEAGTRELQRMYGRDFQVAFRPLERGGVRFTRTILVNAAQVPVETLREGFTSLRDMAWADLPYVCVRSDRGDRWLSNVNVPGGSIRNRRKLYVAEVEINEVAAEPYAPDLTHCEGMTARGSLPSTVYEPRFATTPASAALSSDDASLRVQLRLDRFDQFIPLIARLNPLSEGWAFTYDNGVLRFDAFAVFPVEFVSDPVPFGPGDLYWVRFDYDSNGGGLVSLGQFYTSPDGVTWNPLATTMVLNAPTPLTFADDQPLTIGAVADGTSDWSSGENFGGAGGWNGVIVQAEVRDLDAGGTEGMVLDGSSGAYADSPDHADFDITGDIDVRVQVLADDWTPAGAQTLVGKFAQAGDQRSWKFMLDAAGTLRFRFSQDGLATASSASTVPLPDPGDLPRALRVTLDADNGAAGRTITFYYGPDIDGPWTQLGTPITSGGVVTMFSGTAPVEVGSADAGTQEQFTGTVYAAQVYSGIAGTLVGNPDFQAQAPGTTVFVDSVGKTWTLHGTAAITADPASDTILANPDFSAQDGDTVEFTDDQGNQWNVANGICTVDRRL
jgi:hypothetical protein